MEKTISYGGSEISVSSEIADFLESDRKRQAAQDRSDRRHLFLDESETVQANKHLIPFSNPTLDAVIRNLTEQRLREITEILTDDEQRLLYLRFNEAWSMEQIGKEFGVSKMAISK